MQFQCQQCYGAHTCHGKRVCDSDWQATVIISWLPATSKQEDATAIQTLRTSFACLPLILGKGQVPGSIMQHYLSAMCVLPPGNGNQLFLPTHAQMPRS
eukprot:2332419-Karenia_brevis.AAC.1